MTTRSRTAVLRTALLMATVVAASSCGLNVSDELRAEGIRGATAQGSGVTAPSGTGSGGVAVDGGTTGVVGSTTGGTGGSTTGSTVGGTTGGSGGSTSGTGSTSTGSTSAGAPAPAGGNGGATDVGVTADSITVGSVTTLSGPVPGLFAGDIAGAQAYFSYINSQGGIFGRKLKLAVADDQLDCGQNKTAHQALQPKVLGFVSSLSLYDNCGAPVVAQYPDMPDVSLSFSTKQGELANSFSLAPLVPGYRLGSFEYYKKTFPDSITKMASLVGDIGSAVEIWQGIKAAAESIGYKVAYERNYAPGESDFTSDVIQMRQAGVQFLYFVSADSHTIAKVLNTAKQQGWSPQVIAVGAGDAAYDPSFLKEAGVAAENMYADQAHAAFFNPEDAAIPGVRLYQEWMAKTGSSKKTDLYSAWGWGSALLAVQGLKAAGPNLTRKSWLAAMKNIHRFDADGMFALTNPAAKKPATCYIVLKVINGTWKRQDTPATSFRCDAGYYFHKRK